jgi:diguanylate cyclase (GGDEF)-like protein
MTLSRLRTGAEDARWVQVEGVVRSVIEEGGEVSLELAMADGKITATTRKEDGADYAALVDSSVSIHANASPLFNANRQVIGARLIFPSLSVVRVREAAPHDPFDLPVLTIDSLSKYDQIASSAHRVHIRGTATLQWRGSLLCLNDATHGMCAESAQQTPVGVGESVDVVGFEANGAGGPMLSDAIFRKNENAGHERGLPADKLGEQLTAEQAIKSEHDGNVIQIEGRLIGRDLTAADTTFMLESGKFIFAAVLPKDLTVPDISHLQNGTLLRVTGICSVQIDPQSSARSGGGAISKSFRVLLRSPADVVVLERPSWWTPVHAVLLLSALLVVTLGVMGWVVTLRRQLQRQTQAIRESEERFRQMAQRDTLTGTASRLLLHDRLEAALVRAKTVPSYVGLLMLDLDRFKLINDTLGHYAGDETLRITAERLANSVRKTDLVARLGGDEFIVLLQDLDGPEDAQRIAAKVVAALSEPIQIGENVVPVTVSVGVCAVKGGTFESAELLKSVDTALYHAKAQGRNCYEFFTEEMASASGEKLRLLAGLAHALERNEFELHYQPMVNFETGRLIGFEALLRWRSQALGFMAPDKFIGIAEESGLIVPIGEWVIREACREIGALERELNQTFILSVNLSPLQFQQQGLAPMVEKILAEHGRSPSSMEFEITEGVLMSDSVTATNTLELFRSRGIRLAIDDFGIGFSSFSYIMRFAIDRIKIDRSFVRNLTGERGRDRSTLAVVQAIITMAHGLGIEVVAEGVETEEQFRLLQGECCDIAQGYLLSRPVPSSQFLTLIKRLEERPGIAATGTDKTRAGQLHVA